VILGTSLESVEQRWSLATDGKRIPIPRTSSSRRDSLKSVAQYILVPLQEKSNFISYGRIILEELIVSQRLRK
jgi:hypothetical protein